MIRGLPQFHRGTVAEFAIVDADICARCPANVSHPECASVPLVAITAVKMCEACGLSEVEVGAAEAESKKKVFITGGAGGVGTIAIQIARVMYGCDVTTTASAGAKTELCMRLGATRVVNYREEAFEKVLDAESFDAILDCTGEASKCVKLLKKGGGMCSILAGPTADTLRTWLTESKIDPADITMGVRAFLLSNPGGSIFEAFSGGRSLKSKCAGRGATFGHIIGSGNGPIMQNIARHMCNGNISAVIDKTFSLSDALEAIKYQQSGRAAGKVVVRIAGQ